MHPVYSFTNLDNIYGNGINYIKLYKFDCDDCLDEKTWLDARFSYVADCYRLVAEAKGLDIEISEAFIEDPNTIVLNFTDPNINKDNVIDRIRDHGDVHFSMLDEETLITSNKNTFLSRCDYYGMNQSVKNFIETEIDCPQCLQCNSSIDGIVVENNNYLNLPPMVLISPDYFTPLKPVDFLTPQIFVENPEDRLLGIFKTEMTDEQYQENLGLKLYRH
jgi:hypothetical protein